MGGGLSGCPGKGAVGFLATGHALCLTRAAPLSCLCPSARRVLAVSVGRGRYGAVRRAMLGYQLQTRRAVT